MTSIHKQTHKIVSQFQIESGIDLFSKSIFSVLFNKNITSVSCLLVLCGKMDKYIMKIFIAFVYRYVKKIEK